MQVLFDSPKIKRKLIRLKTYALNNPIDLSNGLPKDYISPNDIKDHVIFNGTTKIVYSIEIQPIGMCHHLSVSKLDKDLPSEYIVDYVMNSLGMGQLKDKKSRKLWIEQGYAINIIQPINKLEKFQKY